MIRAFWVLGLALVCALPCAAQSTGGLTVVVLDEAGEPLPGATVTLSHATGNVRRVDALTDAAGEARFPVLRAGGGYVVEVAVPGLGRRRDRDVRVAIGQTRRHLVTVTTELRQDVTVVAADPIVDLETTSASSRFTDDFVQDLPIQGNAYQNVLTLAPGVNDPDDDGNPTVHGSRSRDFKTIVSGVSNVDPLTGRFFSNINPNSIEEMEIVTGGAGVQFAGAQGGFANIVQKQGTNVFEGVVDLLYNSDKLDGAGANNFDRLAEPEFERVDAGLSFSGPIVRDRLWFFLAHNFIDRDDPLVTASGTEIITTEQETIADSITWQATPRNKFTFRFMGDPVDIGAANVSLFVPRESSFSSETDIETFSFNWESPYSTRIFLNNVISLQNLDFERFPTVEQAGNTCLPDHPFFGTIACLNGVTQLNGGPWSENFESTTKRLNVKSDATIYAGRRWGAEHQVKAGFEMTNERYFFSREQRPTSFYQEVVVPQPLFVTIMNGPNILRSLTVDVVVPPSEEQRATANRYGLYVEDQLKPADNLTVTLGARIDREQINSNGLRPFSPASEVERFFELYDACIAEGSLPPGACSSRIRPSVFTAYELVESIPLGIASQLPPQYGINQVQAQLTSETRDSFGWDITRGREDIVTTNYNFSPYLAFKWDPWSDGKSSIGGSFRRYYNNLFLLVPLAELSPPSTSLTIEVQGFETADGDIVRFAGPLQSSIQTAIDLTVVSRDLRTPYQDELILSVEREIFRETALRLSYVKRDYRDQLQDINLNKRPGDLGRCVEATLADPTTLVDSPGVGPVFDPYTLETYMDTDPGRGDGRIDDCSGKIVTQLVGDEGPQTLEELYALGNRLEIPDGKPDLYVQNPAFGDLFEIGNYNESRYEAFTLELTRRLYRSWEMQGSYTWSTNRGNGDAYDQDLIGEDPSLDDGLLGFQSGDIRHVANVSATSITPWGFRLGGVVRWQSGLPFSLIDQRLAFARSIREISRGNPGSTRSSFIGGERNSERNVPYWNVDLKVARQFTIGRRLDVQLSAQLFNLLDDDTEIIYNTFTETGQRVNGTNDSFRRFGRQWELGAKIAF